MSLKGVGKACGESKWSVRQEVKPLGHEKGQGRKPTKTRREMSVNIQEKMRKGQGHMSLKGVGKACGESKWSVRQEVRKDMELKSVMKL